MRHLIPISFLCLFATMAQAAQFDYPVKAQDKLVITGYSGKVTVTGNAAGLVADGKNNILKIRTVDGNSSDNWTLQVAREDKAIVIKVVEPGQKRDWADVLQSSNSKKMQNHNIEISGAEIPLEINWREGLITVAQWKADARINLLKGKIVAKNDAILHINQQRGDLLIQDNNGKVSVEAYSVNAVVQNLVGDLDLQNFAGESLIEKSKGSLSVVAQSGVSKVTQSSGTLQIENGRGAMSLAQFAGRIEGTTSEGTLNISMSPESEISIKSQAGRVNISGASGTGAFVNLQTMEGEINVPAPLKVARESAYKVVRGRLKGETPKGSIYVRSQEASIFVK